MVKHRRSKKNTAAFGFKVQKMDTEVYQLRKRIMGVIYEAKKKINLPRIEVRVLDNQKSNILGYAYMNSQIIHIPESTAKSNEVDFTHTVLHEILHSIGVEHNPNCMLMSPTQPQNINLKKVWDVFFSYFEKHPTS